MAGGAIALPFDNSYARLPERFYVRLAPTPVAAPRLVKLNTALAAELGLDAAALASPEGVAVLAGNRVALGSEPIALAYAGHQFGNFVPQLGDGRAVLLGEVVGPDGVRRDIQLKGSGPTPFSRRGDGRAALGPVLREYIISEAMAALGIPTTRSLAAVMTGEPVHARDGAARRGADTRGVEPYPGRHLPVLRRARRRRGAAAAGRPRHRPPLPGRPRRGRALSRAVRPRDRAPGRIDRANGCWWASSTAS